MFSKIRIYIVSKCYFSLKTASWPNIYFKVLCIFLFISFDCFMLESY